MYKYGKYEDKVKPKKKKIKKKLKFNDYVELTEEKMLLKGA